MCGFKNFKGFPFDLINEVFEFAVWTVAIAIQLGFEERKTRKRKRKKE